MGGSKTGGGPGDWRTASAARGAKATHPPPLPLVGSRAGRSRALETGSSGQRPQGGAYAGPLMSAARKPEVRPRGVAVTDRTRIARSIFLVQGVASSATAFDSSRRSSRRQSPRRRLTARSDSNPDEQEMCRSRSTMASWCVSTPPSTMASRLSGSIALTIGRAQLGRSPALPMSPHGCRKHLHRSAGDLRNLSVAQASRSSRRIVDGQVAPTPAPRIALGATGVPAIEAPIWRAQVLRISSTVSRGASQCGK